MPGPTQTITVDPTLVGGTVSWVMCHTNVNECGDGSPNDPYPWVVLGANKGHYPFEIKIIGVEEGLEIAFADTDAIEVKSGEPAGPGNKQIVSISGEGTDTLTFRDNNGFPNPGHPDPAVLEYGLNFKGSQPVTPIDPIIINGGTTAKMYDSGKDGAGLAPYSTDYWILVGVVFLAALLGAVVARAVWPANPASPPPAE